MQKSIYSYLQRYLLKALTKPPHYNRNTFLAAHKINEAVKSQKGGSLKLNFLRKYTKKIVRVNCVRFHLISHFFYINNQFLKKCKKQKLFYLSFIKRSSYFIYTIKIKTLINKHDILCKELFGVIYKSKKLLTVSKIKNYNLNTSVGTAKSLPFYFYNNQALNSFIFPVPCSLQINSLTALKSFYNFYFFLSKNYILNRKKDILCNFFSIAFPLLMVAKVPSTANPYGSKFLCHTLTVIHIFCLVTLQYFKEKKCIQNIQYKVFVDLVTFYVYQFNKKILTKVKNKPFSKKIVVINKTVNYHYFLLRPLFALTRFDTFFICQSLRLPIYPDQSNLQVDFLRNRIRKQILPTIRVLINPKFDTILCKFNELYD